MRQRFIATVAAIVLSLFACISVHAVDYTATGTFGDKNKKLIWQLTTSGILKIGFIGSNPSNSTEMPDYSLEDDVAPWAEYREKIKTVEISEGITRIGAYNFYRCTNLSNINFPNTLKSIGRSAFWQCAINGPMGMPGTVETIEQNAFLASGLTQITLPESLKRIEDGAFSNCRITEIHIPKATEYVGGGFCFDNKNLTKITVDEANPTYTSKNYKGEECNAILLRDTDNGVTLVSGCKNTVIPDNITHIGSNAFAGCYMTTIEIPSSVTNIGESAFSSSAITHITIPSSVKQIDADAFSTRTLQTVYLLADTPPALGYAPFENNHNCTIYIYAVDVDKYKYSDWNNEDKMYGAWGTDQHTNKLKTAIPRLYAKYRDSKGDRSLTFYYNQDMDITDYSYDYIRIKVWENIPHYFSVSKEGSSTYNIETQMINYTGESGVLSTIKTVEFDESMRNYKFKTLYHMFEGLTSATFSHLDYLNTSETTIMQYVFKGCEALTSLDLSTFDTSNASYMDGMFQGCKNLESVNISALNTSKVKQFGYMFKDCTSLKSLDLSTFDTSNGETFSEMFKGCTKLESVNLSSFDTSNGKYFKSMFEDCTSLKNLDLSSFDTSKGQDFRFMLYDMERHIAKDHWYIDVYVSDKFKVPANAVTGNMLAYGDPDYKFGSGILQKKVGTLGTQPLGAQLNDKGQYVLCNGYSWDDDQKYSLTETEPVTVGDHRNTYTRQLTNTWGTLCLPFGIDANNTFATCDFYGIESVAGGVITLAQLYDIPAGTPVLFCMKQAISNHTATIQGTPYGNLVATPQNADSGNRLMGTFDGCVLSADDYFLAKDAFRHVGADKARVGAYRAYMALDNTSTTAATAAYSITVGGETTGIGEVLDSIGNGTAEYYTIDGRRTDGLHKGMNIVKVGGKAHKIFMKQ